MANLDGNEEFTSRKVTSRKEDNKNRQVDELTPG
jgi:hypothetical protein